MKGIVLAGGTGSRLWPITRGVSKQLLPVYDKPMVHYPIATLMNAGLRDILIITTPEDQPAFIRLLGDGAELGVRFSYVVQERPEGLAQAFLLGEEFLAGDAAALVLGDNIFHGSGLGRRLAALHGIDGGHVFAYRVANPSEYGVVEFDEAGSRHLARGEAGQPSLQLRGPGLYFYGPDIVDVAKADQALRTWRAGDHGRQPALPGSGAPHGVGSAPGDGLAGHRHVPEPARRRGVRAGHGGPAGRQAGMPRGDRLAQRLDR